ncbi:MAG: sigma 54-interacting transcriptional regulator [Negativicutes bacterium]|nr:sigma 54-interacting transcriptional regulator [Negativicutes bacterium]
MRLKLPNIDRVGLVLDISRALAERRINILSMEVELKTIYIEIEELPAESGQELIADLRAISGILAVDEIELMPYQEKAEQLKAVLASTGDGIIAVDHQARITQCNPAAEKILHLSAPTLLGRHVTDVFPADMALLDTVKYGTVFNNKEIILERTNSHYLTSGRPIVDRSGRIMGAVATLKDISDVRELVHTVTGQHPFTFEELSFRSTAMQQVIALAKAYARGDSTVLIRGETGTGKELLARALHAASPRGPKSFVPVNCAAIPDTLLESELFGYDEGAFTGAARGGKQGLFELADNGTIFLDEIGEISSHLQAKLLRVLQDKKVRRVGSTRENSVNVRILAATNRNLEEMIAKGSFREDLYYRLNVIPLFIPPLRERRDDIPLLAEVFLQRFAIKLQKRATAISEAAYRKLADYNWPGNIRELENVIERAVNILDGPVILADHIILHQDRPAKAYDTGWGGHTLAEILDQTERQTLQAALEKHPTSRRLGAALGLSHTAILKKLHRHGLRPGTK